MAKHRTKSRSKKPRAYTKILAILLATMLAPLLLLNGTVAIVGRTSVFPLSPHFLKEKWAALQAFARHLPDCFLKGHADELSAIVAQAEVRHHLPTGLLAALVHVESGSRVHRISRAGAMGPGQLMASTAQMMGVRDPFDPEQSIDGSAHYLARQLARFKDLRLALAAYNAGPRNVAGRIPINGETEFYVPKVLAEYERRSALLTKTQAAPNPTPSLESSKKGEKAETSATSVVPGSRKDL